MAAPHRVRPSLRSLWLLRHGERPRPRALLVLPASGAIASAAVAWLAVLAAPLTPVAGGHVLPLAQPERALLESLGWRPASSTSSQHFNWSLGFGAARCSVQEAWVRSEDGLESGASVEEIAVRQRAGWPLHCLAADAWRPHPKGGAPLPWRGHAAIVLDESAGGTPSLLPLRPLWPGLLFNSVLYGATLGLVAQIVRESTRYARWRSRRCVVCGYPCGGSPACTECGAPLGASAR